MTTKYQTGTDGVPRLILNRPSKKRTTVSCAFCGVKHTHGEPDGHRVPHCVHDGSRRILKGVLADDGTVLHQKNGYMIVTE